MLPRTACGSRCRLLARLAAGLHGWIALLLICTTPAIAQDTLVPFESSWRFTRGTNEASSPVTAWRNLTFNDTRSRWSSAPAPFHFGESLSIGTQLSDMRSVYTCVYLRKAFVLTNVADINALILDVNYDDGFIAWMNGTEVARALVTNTTFSSSASASHEAGTVVSFTNLFPAYLLNGSNILAIQAPSSSTSRDCEGLSVAAEPPE